MTIPVSATSDPNAASIPTTTSPQSTPSPPSTSLSIGAKAGIGVTAAIGAAAIILGGLIFQRRRQQERAINASGQIASPPDYDMATANRWKHLYSWEPLHELPVPPVELDAGGRF